MDNFVLRRTVDVMWDKSMYTFYVIVEGLSRNYPIVTINPYTKIYIMTFVIQEENLKPQNFKQCLSRLENYIVKYCI